MISRRHIRLKVLQSLYSFSLVYNISIEDAAKKMINQFDDICRLQLTLVSFLIKLVEYADIFLNQQKNKHFPSKQDLNPNKRFINNNIMQWFVLNKNLTKKLDLVKNIWENEDYDIIRTTFMRLYKSKLYKEYITHNDYSIEIDQDFFVGVLDEYVLNDKVFQHILKEENIYWLDDLPFVSILLVAQIKDFSVAKKFDYLENTFKKKDDIRFANDLFKQTVLNDNLFDDIIIENAKNWELDRIASIDKILIKMALSEILYMKELPIKVSLNEYIEISKYYSTKKSKSFINGVLDAAVKKFHKEGKIKKEGRGLN